MKPDPLQTLQASSYSARSTSSQQQTVPIEDDTTAPPPPYVESRHEDGRSAQAARALAASPSAGESRANAPRSSHPDWTPIELQDRMSAEPARRTMSSSTSSGYTAQDPMMMKARGQPTKDHSGQPGCCFSDTGGCCFSSTGGCCFSSQEACCFSTTKGCCFSSSEGCCFSDNGACCCNKTGDAEADREWERRLAKNNRCNSRR